jgi:GT2 family glycosyltransferase
MVVRKDDFKKAKNSLKKKGLFYLCKKILISLYWRLIHQLVNYRRRGLYQSISYHHWIKRTEALPEKVTFGYKPKISILVPTYNVDPKWLVLCIKSVLSQNYDNWELCLYDDASTNNKTIEALKKIEGMDERIKIKYGEINLHISGASNKALEMATGEFVGLLDNDDELAPNALFENVKILNQNKNLKFIYSDEDKITTRGKRYDPYFKSGWNPDLLLSQMYTSHFSIYKKELVKSVGGFRKGFEGSQDYDLVLRVTEKLKPEEISHIPKILYHWRSLKGSTSRGQNIKDYATESSKKALREYLERNKIKAEVLNGQFSGTYRIKREIQDQPLVSIIIPFKDQAKVLSRALNGILGKTSYQNYEILLIDNGSEQLSTKKFLSKLRSKKIRVIKYNKVFNFSAINNFAVKKAKGEYILFLNNDTEVKTKEWLSAMVEQIQRPEIGVVGAQLLYPNNKAQHCGVILGTGVAGHAFKFSEKDAPGYFSQKEVIRNYSAVTAACMMTKRDIFEKLGGFNEKDLAIAYNDIDYCLRVRRGGYLIVYTPYAKLYHFESLTRGDETQNIIKIKNPEKYQRVVAELEYMKEKWPDWIKDDPYYNCNLTRMREDFSLKTKHEV